MKRQREVRPSAIGRLHEATVQRLPGHMQTSEVEIDTRLSELIHLLWQRGYVTRHCCQGEPGEHWRTVGLTRMRSTGPQSAYIQFRSRLEAGLFIAFAGPTSWKEKVKRQRNAEDVPREPAAWEWRLEADTVWFPARDIDRATHALRFGRNGSLPALIGAVRDSDYARLLAPRRCPNCDSELVGAQTDSREVRLPAPKTCANCGVLMVSKRKDARFCSRVCQLQGRDRRSPDKR